MSENDHEAVKTFLTSLDDATRADADVLLELMRRVSGKEPTLWNVGTLGFGVYHYRYDSGREGDGHTIGFYPRKGKLTVYLMDGTARHETLLENLGKHSTTGYCLYIKRLADIDMAVLEQIVSDSYRFIEGKAKAGPITEILWKSEA